LLIAGGHYSDGKGVEKAVLFNPFTNDTNKIWEPVPKMNRGRWYPTAITLADGSVLVSGGTDEHKQTNNEQQIFKNGEWKKHRILNSNSITPGCMLLRMPASCWPARTGLRNDSTPAHHARKVSWAAGARLPRRWEC
jgi:hypothetical protein